MLPDNYEITAQDLEQALARQNMTLQKGDAVILHTGWGDLWGKDNARYARKVLASASPRLEWLVARIRCWSGPTIFRWK